MNIQEIKALFQLVGFRSPSMDDVASHLKISKKTLYKHVANKNELVERIIALHIEEFNASLRALQEQNLDTKDYFIALTKWLENIYKTINKKSLTDLERYYGEADELFKTFEIETCFDAFLPIFQNCLPNFSEKQASYATGLYMNNIKSIAHKNITSCKATNVIHFEQMQHTLVQVQLKALGL